jgi:hypothetical protein
MQVAVAGRADNYTYELAKGRIVCFIGVSSVLPDG